MKQFGEAADKGYAAEKIIRLATSNEWVFGR